jgi:hypothetical protein
VSECWHTLLCPARSLSILMPHKMLPCNRNYDPRFMFSSSPIISEPPHIILIFCGWFYCYAPTAGASEPKHTPERGEYLNAQPLKIMNYLDTSPRPQAKMVGQCGWWGGHTVRCTLPETGNPLIPAPKPRRLPQAPVNPENGRFFSVCVAGCVFDGVNDLRNIGSGCENGSENGPHSHL